MKVRMTCTGTRPLLMHNVRMASPLNAYVKQFGLIKGKLKKTDEDRLAMARIEFEGGMYFDETGPVIPGELLFASILGGAKMDKNGPKVINGVIPLDAPYPLIYRGPRDVAGLWGDDGDSPFVDFRTVKVGQSRVDRCRPIFREWKFEAAAEIDTAVIELSEFELAATKAGDFKGIGDYRQLYGRFSTVVDEL